MVVPGPRAGPGPKAVTIGRGPGRGRWSPSVPSSSIGPQRIRCSGGAPGREQRRALMAMARGEATLSRDAWCRRAPRARAGACVRVPCRSARESRGALARPGPSGAAGVERRMRRGSRSDSDGLGWTRIAGCVGLCGGAQGAARQRRDRARTRAQGCPPSRPRGAPSRGAPLFRRARRGQRRDGSRASMPQRPCPPSPCPPAPADTPPLSCDGHRRGALGQAGDANDASHSWSKGKAARRGGQTRWAGRRRCGEGGGWRDGCGTADGEGSGAG